MNRLRGPSVNPIIVKELRSRMRGPRAYITLTGVLILMALISYTLYQLVIIASTWSYSPLSPQIGQTLFAALAVLEMMMICLITPAVTAGAISGELENLTFEMLLTTPLNPTRIVWGKLIASLSYIFLLLFAAIPIGSLVFIYGGVAPRDMLKALIVLVSTAILLGTIGIFMSTWLKRSGRATIASYLIVFSMLVAPTFIYGIIGIIRQGEPPRWLLVPSPINALFSAIAPSTTLGNASVSMIGGLSMLMGGNLGSMIRIDAIPRPLYHYTMPLYGFITLLLFLFATRLIRPARKWELNPKTILFGLLAIFLFIASVAIAFKISSDRYENYSIFTVPTPLAPMGSMVMEIEEENTSMPFTDAETSSAYAAVIGETINQVLKSDIHVIAISRQTYDDPDNPDQNQVGNRILSDTVQNDLSHLIDDLPIEIIWKDDISEFQSTQNLDIMLVLGNLQPRKPDSSQVYIRIRHRDEILDQTLKYKLLLSDGIWKVQLEDTINPQSHQDSNSNTLESILTLSFDEIASIYAAAILQATSIDTPNPSFHLIQIYIIQSTELATHPIILPPDVQANLTKILENHFLTITWINNADSVSQNFLERDAAIVTLGHITPQADDGSIEVMIDLLFREDERLLVTYFLEKVQGEWQITDFGGVG
jgi:ABC-type transport system involved in multi-copper enzyme maturation permease subunit